MAEFCGPFLGNILQAITYNIINQQKNASCVYLLCIIYETETNTSGNNMIALSYSCHKKNVIET